MKPKTSNAARRVGSSACSPPPGISRRKWTKILREEIDLATVQSHASPMGSPVRWKAIVTQRGRNDLIWLWASGYDYNSHRAGLLAARRWIREVKANVKTQQLGGGE